MRFRPGADRSRADSVHARVRAQVVKRFTLVHGLELVRLPEDMPVERAAGIYRRSPDVLYAEPNYTWRVDRTPNDPRFPELWGLDNTGQSGGTPDADIDGPEAWDLSTGGSDVLVGVIDTGIDYLHPDLQANTWGGPDTVNGDGDPMDDNGHGTHVAGIIGAVGDNGVGVVGVNWRIKLLPCKAFRASGTGPTSAAIACLEYFAGLKDSYPNFVATNNSWSGGFYSKALFDALDEHRRRGILAIASVGNANRDIDTIDVYPASYYLPNIIAVAASTRTDARASFSNFGRHTAHLAAPGEGILSTLPYKLYDSLYGYASGTSMAAPHVTGAAALLRAWSPSLDWKAIKNLLLAGGDAVSPMAGVSISQRRLNVHGAMTCSNSILSERLLPRTDVTTAALGGDPVDLAVLHVNCGDPNGNVSVAVDGSAETITLLDDGLGADQEAGDGIYSGQWVPTTTGPHSLGFPDGDRVQVHVLTPYRFSTSVPFNYRNITGTHLHLSINDSRLITPGFPVLFGGGSFDGLFVNSNGNVTFTKAFLESDNQPIPTATTPALVAPFWDTIGPSDFGGGVNIYWDVVGSQPNRELVIEWRDAATCLYYNALTFQIVFFEGSSSILFNYRDVISGDGCTYPDLGASATVGVQIGTRVGTQFSFDSPSLTDNSSILWELGNPTPAITRLSPFTALAGDPGFTLKVIGSSFLPTSIVRWNGEDRPTTFVDSRQLNAAISADDIAAERVVNVSVFTANAPDGERSNDVPFTIYTTHPKPTLASLSPEEIAVGAASFNLSVTGAGFVSGSVVRWNGADRPTTPLSGSQLTASIPASDVPVGGVFEITIFNPAPGGGLSNPLWFVVYYGIPFIGDYSPSVVDAAGPDFILSIFGSGFYPYSVVRWNGSDRPTIYRGAVSNEYGWNQQLDAAIPASDIATAGDADITVFNPAPGGGLSQSVQVHVVDVPPNDDFADALPISVLPFTHSVNTRLATSETNEPYAACENYPNAAKSVWYRFTPTTTVTVSADDMGGTDYPSSLKIFSESGGSLTPVACRPNSQAGAVGFIATAGTTYYFLITDNQSGTGGRLVFNLKNAPTITELSPASVEVGDPDFVLTVRGSDFVPGSAGRWKEYSLPTTFVDSTQLQILVGSGYISEGGTVPITVVNTVPSYSLSNSLPLTVNNRVPVLTSLSPSGIPAGSASFYLTVNGSNFATPSTPCGGAVVRWNGADRYTNCYHSTTELRALIYASDIAVEGTAQITVFNGPPGGGTSNALPFKIGGCGDGAVESGEACDPAADVKLASCCTASCTSVRDGTACTDGDACTAGDRCQAGACVLGTALIPPREVPHATFEADGSTLTWDAVPSAPPGTVYDVARGLVSELPVGGGSAETCMAYGISSPTTSDLALPGEGQAFWYLVRGRHPCGTGTYGYASLDGVPTAERITQACP